MCKVYIVMDLDFYSFRNNIDTDCTCVYISTDKEAAIKHLNLYVKVWNDSVREDMEESPEDFEGETVELIDNPMDTDDVFEDFVMYYSHEDPVDGDWHKMYIKIEERDMGGQYD